MDGKRLDDLLVRFPGVRVAVVGDFFLDSYLIIDPELSEKSLETGLESFQIVARRCSPGAAGTVTSNIRALGVGTVFALGILGCDGNGYDLRRGLEGTGVRLDYLLESPERFTPTYTKPMKRQPDGAEVEMNRLDLKNREPLPGKLEETLIARLRAVTSEVEGVILADQVPERNCGTITDRVREEIGALAQAHPKVVFVADSRTRIGEFHHVSLKPNQHEAIAAMRPGFSGEADRAAAQAAGMELSARNGRPVFVTVGRDGVLVCSAAGCEQVPGIPVRDPIDIVGAGDSVMAGIVASLCSGATPAEAALVGNLTASLTIQQIGTTGTATPEQVRTRFAKWSAGGLE